MFLICILGNIPPLTEPAIRSHPFLLKDRVSDDSILPHLYGKFIEVRDPRAKSLPNAAIHKPLEMRHAVWLLSLQRTQCSFFRSHLNHIHLRIRTLYQPSLLSASHGSCITLVSRSYSA